MTDVTDGNQPVDEETPIEGEETPHSGGEETPEGETIPKDEVNSIVERRLKRARQKWEEEQQEAARKAKLSAEEKAREEQAEADRRANERVATANQRLIKADAKGVAAEIGVKPERINSVLKLADLSEVEVSDEGEVDGAAVRSALEAVVTEFPEFKRPEYGTAPGSKKLAEGGAPTGIDAQIAEAVEAGDFIKAERLQAEKLAKAGKLRHPA